MKNLFGFCIVKHHDMELDKFLINGRLMKMALSTFFSPFFFTWTNRVACFLVHYPWKRVHGKWPNVKPQSIWRVVNIIIANGPPILGIIANGQSILGKGKTLESVVIYGSANNQIVNQLIEFKKSKKPTILRKWSLILSNFFIYGIAFSFKNKKMTFC